jgi:pimeloyl-ACP methyl ester carboxylesterase
MPTVTGDGVELYYERRGDGPRLLFCNGSGATLASAKLLIDAFTGSFDVVAHDQRGLGRTGVPPGPYTMADYATDALAVVDDVGWDTFCVVGVSFGGMVAQELAVTAPERIERLALMCTSPGGVGGASYPLHELADVSAAERAEIGIRLLDTRFTPDWLKEHPRDQALIDFRAEQASASRSDDQVRGEQLQLEARSHHDVCDRLGRIACPTLVASGRFDGIAPSTNGEAIAARIPNAELRLYEGGHGFFVQDRQAMPDILGFLAG